MMDLKTSHSALTKDTQMLDDETRVCTGTNTSILQMAQAATQGYVHLLCMLS
jgi:hypothetical protein